MSGYSSRKGLRIGAQCWAVLLSVLLTGPSQRAGADVVVLANRSPRQVSARLAINHRESRIKIPAGQQIVMRVQDSCRLRYQAGNKRIRYRLSPNAVYFFSLPKQGELNFRRVDLNGGGARSGRPLTDSLSLNELAELPVKILVDNRDPRPRRVWEKRLRKRIQRVSDILQRHCRLQLKIVAVETWNSGNESVAFKQSLANFRAQTDPRPARLAIGFTGQYEEKKRIHLGVTHGMLQSHILVREWAASMTEAERTEVLLHEIGHYLGAVHSADTTSVMRPVLADEKAIHRSFRIGFDPVNTLIINLLADEIRVCGAKRIEELSLSTRKRLKQVYQALSNALPKDKSARQFLFQLEMSTDTSLSRATQTVVRAVRQAAQSQQPRLQVTSTRDSADDLTEFYVRRAASAATRLPKDVAPSAFLLGLGIAMDDSDLLLRNPITASFSRKVETRTERRSRRQALGKPTLKGRRDLAQHFFLSAYLAVAVGPRAAESAGLAKELADSRSQSGFSYRDLAANAAGIKFAEHLMDGTLLLSDVANGLPTSRLMPKVSDLPEGLHGQEMNADCPLQKNTEFGDYRTLIRRRLRQLEKQRNGSHGRVVKE